MNHHQSLTVGLGVRSYDIAVGRGLLDRIVDITDGIEKEEDQWKQDEHQNKDHQENKDGARKIS